MACHLDIKEELLQCPICIDELDDPRVLQCQHRFCLACLDAVVKSSESKGFIICPVCRVEVDTPAKGATGFPRDIFAHQLKDSLSRKRKEGKVQDKSSSAPYTYSTPVIGVNLRKDSFLVALDDRQNSREVLLRNIDCKRGETLFTFSILMDSRDTAYLPCMSPVDYPADNLHNVLLGLRNKIYVVKLLRDGSNALYVSDVEMHFLRAPPTAHLVALYAQEHNGHFLVALGPVPGIQRYNQSGEIVEAITYSYPITAIKSFACLDNHTIAIIDSKRDNVLYTNNMGTIISVIKPPVDDMKPTKIITMSRRLDSLVIVWRHGDQWKAYIHYHSGKCTLLWTGNAVPYISRRKGLCLLLTNEKSFKIVQGST